MHRIHASRKPHIPKYCLLSSLSLGGTGNSRHHPRSPEKARGRGQRGWNTKPGRKGGEPPASAVGLRPGITALCVEPGAQATSTGTIRPDLRPGRASRGTVRREGSGKEGFATLSRATSTPLPNFSEPQFLRLQRTVSPHRGSNKRTRVKGWVPGTTPGGQSELRARRLLVVTWGWACWPGE